VQKTETPAVVFHPDSEIARKPAGRPKGKEKALKFVNSDDAITAYLAEIKHIKSLTMEEERTLAYRIQKGGPDGREALNALVQANLKFVVAVCRNYQHQGLPMGDLINEGNLGLMRAAQRFDASMNYKFISYAVWWIRQGILAALAEQSRVLRIAPSKVTEFQKIGRASQKLEQELGRQPTLSELAERMGMSDAELNECLQLASHPVSIHTPQTEEEDGTLENVLEDKDSESPDKSTREHLLKDSMAKLLDTLDEREAEILRLYYGLGRPTSLTLEEIARRFDLTRERVRQLKTRALERLRHPSRMPKLNKFRD
jgi:RNA polymerase primary sigma factor